MKASIKVKNFEAQLPEDFLYLQSIRNNKGEFLCFISPYRYQYESSFTVPFEHKQEWYYLDAAHNRILFCGKESSVWLFKQFQKLYSRLFPKKYIIEYKCALLPLPKDFDIKFQ